MTSYQLPARTIQKHTIPKRIAVVAGATVAALAVAALVNRYLASKAERDNPPVGRFIDVDGVRLHYIDRGAGETVVLLHGNGSMIQDFESSGVIETAARKYRVIAFDRPGFGHSARPRGTIWTPQAQAELIHRALKQIGIPRYAVVGHSWGASVALALAMEYPKTVAGLVLASGYYYPSMRADVLLMSGPAVPVLGDILSYTVSPIISRLLWPLLLRKIFGPAPVPDKFLGFPKEMAVRPSQLRASAAETALMISNAVSMQGRYGSLNVPVVIIAGDQDRLVNIDKQSARLHRDMGQSRLRRVAGAGHMVHQTAPALVMAALDEALTQSGERESEGGPSTVNGRVQGL
jgi:pimeloyl-ACP methyl ester carboxylesterase